jgi:glycosyltransferase involved in cell wall biosynthesis
VILFTKLGRSSTLFEGLNPSISAAALVPAFHCAGTVGAVVEGVRPHVEMVLVVDDGSGDGTAEEAFRAGAQVLVRKVNGGKGTAVRQALSLLLPCGFTHVAFVDGDGQHDPADLPALLAAAGQGADFVIGSRLRDRGEMPAKNFIANATGDRILSRMTGLEVEDGQSGYRVIASELLRPLQLTSRRYAVENEILIKASHRVRNLAIVPIRSIYVEGGDGRRHYRPFRDTWVTSWLSVHFKTTGNDRS